MKALTGLLILTFAVAFSYSVPFVIEHHAKQSVTTTHPNDDRGAGRGIVISTPPPR